MHEFLNVDRVPRDSFIVRSYATMDERTNERDDIVRIEAMVTRARVVGRSNARATRESIGRSRGAHPAWPRRDETNAIDSDSD